MKKIKISTSSDGYHYLFSCITCQKETELITGMGRYGNLGEFHCPYCSKKYYATIDDHQKPKCYIFEIGEQPSSMLDLEGRKHGITLEQYGEIKN
ncbi:MAG: hypothetical protein K2H82_10200 [Oscillospiraceae bacterium]|nr:hypothetical protein [Oscillospiraceae bacterium]